MNVVSFIEPHLEHLSMLSFTVEQTRCFKVNPQEDKCKNTREKKDAFFNSCFETRHGGASLW